MLRVLPYSACQLCSYEAYKRLLGGGPDGKRLSVPRRLAAGAAAGMTSTLVRFPPAAQAPLSLIFFRKYGILLAASKV